MAPVEDRGHAESTDDEPAEDVTAAGSPLATVRAAAARAVEPLVTAASPVVDPLVEAAAPVVATIRDPDDWPLNAWQASTLAFALALVLLYSPLVVDVPGETLVFLDVAIVFTLFAMLTTGLNFHFGHTGLVNFGHVAFFAVGGYAAAMLTASDPFAGIGLGLPWPVGIAGAVVAAAVLGGLLGISTLRLRDDFLAIVTLAVAEILHDLLGSLREITGGGVGLGGVPRPVGDLTDAVGTERVATLLAFGAVALLTYAVFRRLSSAPYGRVLHAIRADDQVTATLGKDVFRYKLAAFVYGAVVAGIAGSLYAFEIGAVSPELFTIDVTVLVWVGMLIGGPGNDRGVIAGVAVILAFRLATRFLNDAVPAVGSDLFASIRLVMVGALLIVVIRYRPEGIWGNAEELGVDG